MTFSSESVLHIRWPKYWSFSFSISPSNEYSGLIAFRIDWLDLLAVQGTLKSLLQHHHSSKASLERVAIPFSRDLPNSGIEPGSPVLKAGSLPSEPPGKSLRTQTTALNLCLLYKMIKSL